MIPLALSAAQLSLPLGRVPKVAEPPRAPIETAGPQWVAACTDDAGKPKDGWDDPAPPVRIHANTYYVGTCGIAAILITGNDGHVLIDSGTEKGADLIAANIRRLGFRVTDVRYLLHSHEHIDHVGGMARLQQLTGARLVASEAAARVFATGLPTADDPQAGLFPPIRIAAVDRVIRDGETLRLGDLALVAVATPGHTPGALTWHWGACDGGVCRRIVYADSLNPISKDSYRFSDHPEVVRGFRASLGKLAALECDILLTPHPSASNLPARFAGREPIDDTGACKALSATIGKRLDDRLAKEAAGK
jgi:metallo-beta-lactamase class B